MKRFANYGLLLLCCVGFTAACVRVQAQQMSPVIGEFSKKARGTVEVINTGDVPKIVSCQAQSFDADEHGMVRAHLLDAALHVRLAAERVEVPPKGSRQISFDATPAAVPAWFLVKCQFVPVQRSEGMTIAMVISSVVIIHGGSFDTRDVALSAKRTGTKVEVEVRNNGAGLARVDSGEILGHRKQVDIGTFILYPHQKRLVEEDWEETASPETVRIQIGKKRLESPVN